MDNTNVFSNRDFGLTKNQIKMIAALTMVIDHVGAEFFPELLILRIIGRLSFPIFSYGIYEGCKYTRNKGKYLLRVFALGLVCVVAFYVYSGTFYGNVLITFSLSICVNYCIQYLHKAITERNGIVQGALMTAVCVTVVYIICNSVFIDYGFWGVMLPACALIAEYILPVNKKIASLTGFLMGLLLLSYSMQGVQMYCIASIIILAFSSGKRGKYALNGFFYWFYPVHLAVIGIISMVV